MRDMIARGSISAVTIADLARMREQLIQLAHSMRIKDWPDRELIRDAASLIRDVLREVQT